MIGKIKAMSLGKKIYATLWAIWFAMLIVFIAVSSALDSKKSQTIGGLWSLKNQAGAEVTVPPAITFADGTTLTQALKDKEAWVKYNAELTASAQDVYFDKFEGAVLSESANDAQNAIAGVGLGFFVTLAGAVFTTVGVEVVAKTKGGKK